MDIENIEYLNNIARRVEYYYATRRRAVKFVIDNKIQDKDLTVNIVLMSAVWAAHQRNEELTEEELVYLFGLVSKDGDNDITTRSILTLHSSQTNLSLEELLNATMKSYNPK